MNQFKDLPKLIKSGAIKPQELINLAERDVKLGRTDPAILTQLVRYLALIDKILKMQDQNQLMNLQEFVDCGLANSIDEVYYIIDKHPEQFQQYPIYKVKPCEYPTEWSAKIPADVLDEMDLTSVSDQKICIICCERLRCTVFIPCGHSLCCTVCSKTLADNAKEKDVHVECLVCKKNVDRMNRIFL